MLKIKDLKEAGVNIQLRIRYATEFYDIEDLENLSTNDLLKGNYDYTLSETCWFEEGNDKDLWLEYKGKNSAIYINDFKELLDEVSSIDEFVKEISWSY